jgi:hypothetical protein
MNLSTKTFNFDRLNYTIDSSYKLGKRSYLSSWNSYAAGRDKDFGGDYFISSNLINFKSKNYRSVISAGHQFISIPLQGISRNELIIQFSYKLF